jgi:hypothetical protein
MGAQRDMVACGVRGAIAQLQCGIFACMAESGVVGTAHSRALSCLDRKLRRSRSLSLGRTIHASQISFARRRLEIR